MKFIGREQELSQLEKYFGSEAISTCAIYGRRRVGKTTLIDKFCEGKPSIRFNLSGTDPDKILDHIAMDISRYTGEDMESIRDGLKDFDSLILFLSSLDPDERTVVVLDELPDAMKCFTDVPSSVMRYVDGDMKHQKVFLMICGSSISAMTSELNDSGKPLFKRFPIQMKLLPMPYKDARKFHPGLPEDDVVRMYAIASGIPLYHSLMSAYGSPREAITELFLGRTPPLIGEAHGLLSIEVSPQSTYHSVLTNMGKGMCDVKRLAEKTGLSKNRCRQVLSDMEFLGIVEEKRNYGKPKRTPEFRICDGFMDFYYSILAGNEALLEWDRDDAFDTLKGSIDMFYGKRFEDVCAEYIRSTESCRWLGRWWGKVPVRDESGDLVKNNDGKVKTTDSDVDIVAKVARGDAIFVIMAECKFTRWRCGPDELDELKSVSENALLGGENVEYVMFSRSGFTTELREKVDMTTDERIRLVSIDDIRDWGESEGTTEVRRPRCRSR